jgi:hypothetical protein
LRLAHARLNDRERVRRRYFSDRRAGHDSTSRQKGGTDVHTAAEALNMTQTIRSLILVSCAFSLGTPACGSPPDVVAGSTAGGEATPTKNDGINGVGSAKSATGEEQVVIQTSTFTVQPGEEVYKCQDFTSPLGGKAAGIVATDTNLTVGSHHMFAFVMPNDALTLFDGLQDCPSGGTEFHEYLTTAGSPKTETAYAKGVGRYFDAASGVRMNVHLFNATTEPVEAFVKLTIRYVDPALLEYKAASIFLNYFGLRVPPGVSTQTARYVLPTDISLIGAASHMHKWGKHFEAKTSDGLLLYETDEWAEPAPARFDPPLVLPKGTAIEWSCEYDNDTGSTISFGDSAIHNEMCIFPGEFFNAQGVQLNAQYPLL